MTIREILNNSGIKYTWKDASRIGELAKKRADQLSIIPKLVPQEDYTVYKYPKKFIKEIELITIKHFSEKA